MKWLIKSISIYSPAKSCINIFNLVSESLKLIAISYVESRMLIERNPECLLKEIWISCEPTDKREEI